MVGVVKGFVTGMYAAEGHRNQGDAKMRSRKVLKAPAGRAKAEKANTPQLGDYRLSPSPQRMEYSETTRIFHT